MSGCWLGIALERTEAPGCQNFDDSPEPKDDAGSDNLSQARRPLRMDTEVSPPARPMRYSDEVKIEPRSRTLPSVLPLRARDSP